MPKLNNPDLLEHRNSDFIGKVTGTLKRTIWPYHRAEVRGLERIPKKNGVIYVGNHNGYPYMTEAFILTSALFEQFGMSRYPYILMHDLPLRLPLTNQFFTKYGCVRASPGTARRALELDEPLLIYPGGDEELMRPHRNRTLRASEGDGR